MTYGLSKSDLTLEELCVVATEPFMAGVDTVSRRFTIIRLRSCYAQCAIVSATCHATLKTVSCSYQSEVWHRANLCRESLGKRYFLSPTRLCRAPAPGSLAWIHLLFFLWLDGWQNTTKIAISPSVACLDLSCDALACTYHFSLHSRSLQSGKIPRRMLWRLINLVFLPQTSCSVLWLMYELARNDKVQERLHDEVSNVLGKERDVTPETIKELRYMKACLKESLR